MDYQKYYEKYQEDGCIKIENFLTAEEVDLLKQGLVDMVENMPEDVQNCSPVGGSKKKEEENNSTSSSYKLSYTFECEAVDSEGNIIGDKRKALKFVGPAIHWWNPECKEISFRQKFKDLFKAFGYKDPVICSSLMVFKNPKTAEKFEPNQDSGFFYTEPPSLICLWMPLDEDTSVENGCLWFLPGSHKSGKIYQRCERNTEEDSCMVMRGELPDLDQDKFVPITTKIGDLGLLHGSVFHKGSRNNTDKRRAVYVLFAVEKASKWSELNEGQPGEKLIFSSINDC